MKEFSTFLSLPHPPYADPSRKSVLYSSSLVPPFSFFAKFFVSSEVFLFPSFTFPLYSFRGHLTPHSRSACACCLILASFFFSLFFCFIPKVPFTLAFLRWMCFLSISFRTHDPSFPPAAGIPPLRGSLLYAGGAFLLPPVFVGLLWTPLFLP